MSTHFGTYASHSNSLDCPGCGAQGALRWENAPSIHGGQQLVAIEGDFYERLGRKKPYAIELVCNGCGTVQNPAQVSRLTISEPGEAQSIAS